MAGVCADWSNVECTYFIWSEMEVSRENADLHSSFRSGLSGCDRCMVDHCAMNSYGYGDQAVYLWSVKWAHQNIF